MVVVTMRSLESDTELLAASNGSREMSIRYPRLFRRTPDISLPIGTLRIERSKYLLSSFRPLASLACISTVPLDPRRGLRRISHITFRGLHLLHLFSSSSSLQLPSLSSFSSWFVPNASTLARNRV